MTNEITKRPLDYYIDLRGPRPFLEWLQEIKDIGTRARIKVRLDRMKLGHFGHYRSVGEGVFELKIDWGPGYRVYFGFGIDTVILLLWGGSKTTQQRDILRAQKYWADYRRQNADKTRN